ncbi:MAG TPA: methyltransferase domain-containing protein [Gemmatimonadaceae bacterium]|nr:methyltransferase domain-containing protein [Gemmatimonadaceae bacterium]
MTMLVPARRDTPEFLDDPRTDARTLATTGGEIAECNRLFGGRAAFLSELAPLWPLLRPAATMLDVGCGVGDLPAAARTHAARFGVQLTVIALDRRDVLAARAAANATGAVVADAFALPLRDASVDIVTACQFLHHFSEEAIATLAREMGRVARHRVVVSDLRRSWVAAGGLWLVSWPLRFHRITRHDGVASVLKGFEPHELRASLTRATGRTVTVTRRAGFRVTASWAPRS